MSDLRSALPEASFDGAVHVAEAGLRGMITLKGDFAAPAFRNAAEDVAGVGFPDPGGASVERKRGLCWMAPDELLIFVPYADVKEALTRLETALADTHFLAANVSDARAVFTVTGPGAREVLAKLTPADLRPAAFGPGQMRRTRLAQVPAAFRIGEDGAFEVICFRSVASYVFGLLSNAGREGTLPGHF